MLQHKILTVCLFALATFNIARCNDQEEEQLTLKDLLQTNNYDKRVRPSGLGGSGPTVVEVNLYVRDIDFIDEQKHMYGLQLTFRQKWQDRRLAYNTSSTSLKFLSLLDVTEVWTPDLFFANDKEAKLHDLMKPNHYVRIFPTGEIVHSSRISLKLACPMDYKTFPFDNQTCTLRMASYGYINKEVKFEWKESDPIQISPVLVIPKFTLEDFSTSTCDSTTNTGTYSCLKFNMMFARTFSPYLLNLYIPCLMMVIAAWLGTFLDKRSVTARALVALSTMYVMATQVSQFNAGLPSVDYTKAVDVWTGVCLTFVFATFAEFIAITHLMKTETDGGNQNEAKNCLLDSNKQGSIKGAASKWLVGNGNTSDKIDSVFRAAYPFVFALFSAIYFLVY